MAVSDQYCSHWGYFFDHQHLLNPPETTIFSSQPHHHHPPDFQETDDLLNFPKTFTFPNINYVNDPYFDHQPTNIFYPEIFPLEDFESSHHCPKRQNTYYPIATELWPKVMAPLPEFQIPPPPPPLGCESGGGGGGGERSGKKGSGGGRLSAQSVAARERRRKIAEKTQELGKLVPGGSVMNTAEMFQNAFKYVKFLQAQVGILEFMASIMETKEELQSEELQILTAAPIIQEKLYSEGKCLVPMEFVQILAKDHEILTNPLISKDIDQFLTTVAR